MKKKKTALRYKKERVLFSDVLPYEIPLIFSNRFLYTFLVNNKIEVCNGQLKWDKNISHEAFEIVKLLFCLEKEIREPQKHDTSYKIKKSVSVPFTYRIAHKETAFRDLSIIHPLNQIMVVSFYEKYKPLILHYCSISNFSIRYPVQVASYYFYKDKLHRKLLGRKTDGKEEFMREYENLKSYFSYREFSQIYKFYESESYQTSEKQFLKQFRFDIQSCFDSIYTHSIAWAIMGNKTLYKHYFTNSILNNKSVEFGSTFDSLMQRMNHNETNGILIGPEFSRIFAEIILQHIDIKTENQLEVLGYKNGVDYKCFRYVDDYFVYYNDQKVKDAISEHFASNLKEFKMGFNLAKSEENERPFITSVSIAKEKIDNFIKENLRIDITSLNETHSFEDKDDTTEKETENYFSVDVLKKYLCEDIRLFFNHKNFNIKYKIIIRESNVKYRDIINYTLSRISSQLEKLLSRFDDRFKYLTYFSKHLNLLDNDDLKQKCIDKQLKFEKLLTNYLVGVIDSVFFLYSGNKRINTTLKVISILNVIVIYIRNNYHTKRSGRFIRFQSTSIETIYRKIQSEILLSLETYNGGLFTQLESLFLLIPLKELGSDYNIPFEVMEKFISKNGNAPLPLEINSFVIIIVLYYCQGQQEYAEIISKIKQLIISKIERIHFQDRRRNSEIMHLVLDLLTCPSLSVIFKNYLLSLLGVTEDDKQQKILSASDKQKVWFTNWKDFNLNYELSAKISQEVY